jgi:hypothetical protein
MSSEFRFNIGDIIFIGEQKLTYEIIGIERLGYTVKSCRDKNYRLWVSHKNVYKFNLDVIRDAGIGRIIDGLEL